MPNTSATKVITSTWEKGPDGSVVSFMEPSKDTLYYSKITRCWKRSNGYDCLYVSEIPLESEMGTSAFSAWRFQSSHPSNDIADVDISNGGYGCQFDSGARNVSETMSSAKGLVNSNTIALDGDPSLFVPWTHDEKIHMQKSYGAKANAQFDCPGLARLLVSTSLAAVATERVTFDQMMQ